MSETFQFVKWALEQGCKLRSATYPLDINDDRLGILELTHHFAFTLRNPDLRHEDVAIISHRLVGDFKINWEDMNGPFIGGAQIPSTGILLSKTFGPYGGLDAILEMCKGCPANTLRAEPAGCTGYLNRDPDSEYTEKQLQRIVARLGIREQLNGILPNTKPMWHGLWIESPIPKKALPLFHRIFTEFHAETQLETPKSARKHEERLRCFSKFKRAIELALKHDLRLHVSLPPPGHMGYGYYTTFSHCPRCKADAWAKRWQRKYSSEPQTCRVCGASFTLADTAKRRRMRDQDDEAELEKLLGPERYRKFVIDYLQSRGATLESAEATMKEVEATDARGAENRARHKEKGTAWRRFLREKIYAGLTRIPPPPEECEDIQDKPDPEDPYHFWFEGLALEEALKRASALGIECSYIVHASTNLELDRNVSIENSSPLDVLTSMQTEGCGEKFHAFFKPTAEYY